MINMTLITTHCGFDSADPSREYAGRLYYTNSVE